MTGYDTAGRIQDTYRPAYAEFGASPDYWIRYFHPSPAADLFNDGAMAESIGAWESGGGFVGCISAPVQSRLSGSAAEGQADAQAFAAALLSAYHAVHPLELPANNQLYCWLDQEYSTSLSPAYWNAWANYIAERDFDGLGTYPLYPCLYCDPYSPYPNCTTIAKSTYPAPSGPANLNRAGASPSRRTGMRIGVPRFPPGSGSSASRTRATSQPMSTSMRTRPGS